MGSVLAKEDPSRRSPLGLDIKEPRFGSGEHPCEGSQKPETKTVDLQGISARVDRVNVEGLVRTKDDVIQKSVKELFNAQNFEEMIVNAHLVRGNLQKLGCFRNIAVHIDTSNGKGATKNGYEVTYQVNELKRVHGGVSTNASNNEGSLVVNLGLPNLFGRGENLKGEYSYGSRRTRIFNLSLTKPFVNSWDSLGTISLFQNDREFPVSGYKVIDRGVLFSLGFTSLPKVRHIFQWEGNWRELGVGNRYASFEIREDSGNTLKSALSHIVSVDKRDSPVFPTCGYLFKYTTEFAGVGGNVGFLKNEMNVQGNWSFFEKDLVVQLSLNGGVMNVLDSNKEPAVCDNFFLGGPFTLRGFDFRGVGPQADGNFVGGKAFWSTGVNLFTPLPFRPGSGGFGDLFRLHLFLNAGNIGDFDFSDTKAFFDEQIENTRLACGVGLAFKLGHIARVELNYCLPVLYTDTDAKVDRFQIGVGMNFI